MNTLQRLFVVVAVMGSSCWGQTSSLPADRAAATANGDAVLLASNGASIDAASAIPPVTQTMLLRPVVPAELPTKPTVSARQREAFYGLMAVEHGAALLDAWSTRDVLRQGGRELDPLVRPFAHSSALYAALQVAPFGVDYFANKLMRSNHRVLRGMWWVPQLVATAGSTYCGVSNLGNRR